jgi:hypothetical protein
MMIGFRLVLGYVLIIASGLILYLVIPIALSFGIIAASLLAVPILSLTLIGYSLIAKLSVGQFLKWLFSALIMILLIWSILLLVELRILLWSFLALSFGLSFYWYYRKYKSRKSLESGSEI